MKNWYIQHNGQSLGPYTIAELQSLGVRKEDYVWKEGFSEWKTAGSINDLESLFSQSIPPPFSLPNHTSNHNYQYDSHSSYGTYTSSSAEKTGYWLGRNWRVLLGILIFAVIAYFIVASRNSNTTYFAPLYNDTNSERDHEELKVDIANIERTSPTQFLNVHTEDSRPNLIGERVVEGRITNNATVATYKDIKIEVSYNAKTGTVLYTRYFTIYEKVAPGKSIPFKVKKFMPKTVKGASVKIVTADNFN